MLLLCLVEFVPDPARASQHSSQHNTEHRRESVLPGKHVYMDLQIQWNEAIKTDSDMDGTGYWTGIAGVL